MVPNSPQASYMQAALILDEENLSKFADCVNDPNTTDVFFRRIAVVAKFMIDAELDARNDSSTSTLEKSTSGQQEAVPIPPRALAASSTNVHARPARSALMQESELHIRTTRAVTLECHSIVEAGPYSVRRGRNQGDHTREMSRQPNESLNNSGGSSSGTNANIEKPKQHSPTGEDTVGGAGNPPGMPRFSQILPRNTDSTLLPDDHVAGVDLWGVPTATATRTRRVPQSRNTDSTFLSDEHIPKLNIFGAPYTSGAC